MSGGRRIERARDEAAFKEVFADGEHDHASASAREGIDHVEAAAIEKDYAPPKRPSREKGSGRTARAGAPDRAGGEPEAADDPHADAPATKAPRQDRPDRPRSARKGGGFPQTGHAPSALRAAALSGAGELEGEDDTGSLAGAHSGLGTAGRLARRLGSRSAARPAEGEARPLQREAKTRAKGTARRGHTAAAAPASQPPAGTAAVQGASGPKAAGVAAKIAAAVSAALPGAAAGAAVAASAAVACAAVVAILSFSWFWDDANKKKAAVELPPGCEALRADAEAACTEVFGDAGWTDMVLAIMAAESGGDLGVVAAGGATYVYCVGGCGTPLSSVKQDVMQASECGYGGIIVHGASKGSAVTCCPSVGPWPYASVEASTARASIYAGTLYLRDGLEMWGGYLGEIGTGDIAKLALVAQGYNYNMSSWFSWCKARGITEYTLETSKRFQETLPAGFKGTANHAEKVMAFYPYGHGSSGGNEDQAELARIAASHATNEIYYQQYCAKWVNDMYELAFGPGTCKRYASAWLDWQANGVSSSMGDVPLGAAVYASGWGYPGMGNANPYGHVGIYVGDGKVADYSGVHDLRTWASQQGAVCNGHVGWLGWGWVSGDDLTKH